jgi:simple sugar transport system substrate-binding protein
MDQAGKTVECKGGDRLSNEQILSMNWYVKGVDDKIPSKLFVKWDAISART